MKMKTLRAVLEQLRLKQEKEVTIRLLETAYSELLQLDDADGKTLTFQARDGMVGDQIVTIAEPVGDSDKQTPSKTTEDHLRELHDTYQYGGPYLIKADASRLRLSLGDRWFLVTGNKVKPACENCGGTGKFFPIDREGDAPEETCPVCKGKGFV